MAWISMFGRGSARCALGAACAILLADAAQGQPAMFHGGATHAGAMAGSAVRAFGGLRWRVQTAGPVRATPVIAGSAVYVGSADEILRAIDLESGRVLWQVAVGGPVASAVAVEQDRVFVVTSRDQLVAVDRVSGRVQWRYTAGARAPLAWGSESGLVFDASPTLADGRVLFGATDGFVHAVNPRTGKLLWKSKVGGRVYGSPAVSGRRVFVGTQEGYVYALSLDRGVVQWKFATAGAHLRSREFGFDRTTVQSSPTVDGETVYVGARDGFFYAINARTGVERWHVDHEVSWVNSTAAVGGGAAYLASSDGHFVQAVRADNGAELWRFATTGIVWASPVIDDELVYVGEGDGTFYALNRRTGTEVWRWRSSGRIVSSAALSTGVLVVGSDDGGIYALVGGTTSLRRAVYYDTLALRQPMVRDRALLKNHLVERGYQLLNNATVATFMADRVRDKQPATVVFALDHVPSTIARVPADTVLFRRFLDTGGTVVWCGLPPMIAPETLQGLKDLDRSAPARLIGVTYERGNFDPLGAAATQDARSTGFPSWWLTGWSADTNGLARIFARDEKGQAASWLKRFGANEGRFLRVPCDLDGAHRNVVPFAAEWRP